MSKSQPHNRAIATGDKGIGKRSRPPKLSPSGILQFGKHRGEALGQVPLAYLQWMRQEGVLDTQKGAQAVLDDELRRRKQSPQGSPTRELVSAMGFVIFGPHKDNDISKIGPSGLKRLLKTKGITERSKERIQNVLTKRQRAKRKKRRKSRK